MIASLQMLNILLLPTLEMNFHQCEVLFLLNHILLTASTIVLLIYIVVNGEPIIGGRRKQHKIIVVSTPAYLTPTFIEKQH